MRFAEYSYLRGAKKDVPEHTERSQVFLVDAWSLAKVYNNRHNILLQFYRSSPVC